MVPPWCCQAHIFSLHGEHRTGGGGGCGLGILGLRLHPEGFLGRVCPAGCACGGGQWRGARRRSSFLPSPGMQQLVHGLRQTPGDRSFWLDFGAAPSILPPCGPGWPHRAGLTGGAGRPGPGGMAPSLPALGLRAWVACVGRGLVSTCRKVQSPQRVYELNKVCT
eukprot:SAG22_NODE_153_length_17315_cov_69.981935_3_plen_165_part_00